MSKIAIVYASIHHGNTKKLVDAIASQFEVDLIDATKESQKDMSEYDVIGLASGIYGFQFHQAISNFAKESLPMDKKIFFLFTSAMPKDFSSAMNDAIAGKNATVLGTYSCRGYNTFGPFKLVGGTSKGHPDEKDIQGAIDFYKGLGL